MRKVETINGGFTSRRVQHQIQLKLDWEKKIVMSISYFLKVINKKYIEDEEGKGCWEENTFVDKEQQFCLLQT